MGFKYRKGYRKYRCEECKAESFHHWVEKNRAARIRCPGCGSARLEAVTREAKEEEIIGNLNRVEGEVERPGVVLGKSHTRHRKVT